MCLLGKGRYLIILFAIILMGKSAHGWSANIYPLANYTGDSLEITSTGCANLEDFSFCKTCGSANLQANSISTNVQCLRLHKSKNCAGEAMMDLNPGELCYKNLADCRLKGRVKSISECSAKRTKLLISSLSEGDISSTNFPSQYKPNENINWIVTVPYGKMIEIEILSFSLESDNDCRYDKLHIKELVTESSIFEGCGSKGRQSLISQSNQVHINFKSDSGAEYQGFHLHWKAFGPDLVRDPLEIEAIGLNKFQVYNSSEADVPQVQFITYEKAHPTLSQYVGLVDLKKNHKNVFYIPGYTTPDLYDGREIKDAFFQGTDDVDTVTLVDWRKLSLPIPESSHWQPINYQIVALQNVPTVANILKDLLIEKLNQSSNVYLVGFSLGAHVAGTAARQVALETGWIINRITGLDPAGKIFEHSAGHIGINQTNTLRKTDAQFVDVVHTSSVLGMTEEIGHLDVFVKDKECTSFNAHQKALEVYMASLTSCSLITCPKPLIIETGTLIKEHICNTTNHSELSSLGYLADKYEGRGAHEVYLYKTTWTSHISTGNCSAFLNLPLPAKQRVCRGSPNDALNGNACATKPYLSSCPGRCLSDSFCTYNGISLDSSKIPDISGRRHVTWRSGCPSVSCRNELGEPVPFFVLYKLPYSCRYFVITQTFKGDFEPPFISQLRITDESSFLGETLSQIYSRESSLNHLMWTDLNSTGGSGVLGFDNSSGFLLLHSVPGFPLANLSSYLFPNSSLDDAHISFCVNLHSDNRKAHENKLVKIIHEISSVAPNFYEKRINENVNESIKAVLSFPSQSQNRTEVEEKRSKFPMNVGPFDFNLYTSEGDVGAPEILSDEHETELQFHTKSSPPCNQRYLIGSIQSVKIKGVKWGIENDLSRWAISVNPYKPLTCIGDFGRENKTEGSRRMFICTKNNHINNVFKEMPVEIEEC